MTHTRKPTKFGDLPLLACFEFGGVFFEKQSAGTALNLTDEILVPFHRSDEVVERIPDKWESGRPVFYE